MAEPTKLLEFRKKYPQYDDVSDAKLAFSLRQKFYPNEPLGSFAKDIGLDDSEWKNFITTAEESGYEPTFKSGSQVNSNVSTGGDLLGSIRSGFQGLTLGGGDEIVAGGASVGRKIMGDDRSFSDIYGNELKRERDRLKIFEKTNPKTSTVSELSGALALPLKGPKTLFDAAKTGAKLGGAYGFLSSEGDADERLKEGAISGALGILIGGAFQKGADLLGKPVENLLTRAARNAAQKGGKALDDLRTEASMAFENLKNQGIVFGKEAYETFVEGVINKVTGKSGTLVSEKTLQKLSPKSMALVSDMTDALGKSVGLDDITAFRQLANQTKQERSQDGSAAKSIVKAIDEFIEEAASDPSKITTGNIKGAKEQLENANALWSKLMKTQEIEDVINTASRYAGGFESGLKNQLNTILKNAAKRGGARRKGQNYTAEELKILEEIAQGSKVGNILSAVSRLGISFTGGRNTFNTAVTGGGTAAAAAAAGASGPVIAAVTIMAVAAPTALRYAQEMSMKRRAEVFRGLVSSGKAKEFLTKSPKAYEVLRSAFSRSVAPISQARPNTSDPNTLTSQYLNLAASPFVGLLGPK